jgi:hypothetical protein
LSCALDFWEVEGSGRDMAARLGMDVPALELLRSFMLSVRDFACLSVEDKYGQELLAMLGMFASVRAFGQAKTDSGIHGLKQNENKH